MFRVPVIRVVRVPRAGDAESLVGAMFVQAGARSVEADGRW
ncbi:hypothetical protein [Nocardia gipuzkoensis]